MSPTSYQTAPPRGGILTKGWGEVKALGQPAASSKWRAASIAPVASVAIDATDAMDTPRDRDYQLLTFSYWLCTP